MLYCETQGFLGAFYIVLSHIHMLLTHCLPCELQSRFSRLFEFRNSRLCMPCVSYVVLNAFYFRWMCYLDEVHRTSTKYGFSVSEFIGLVDAFFGALGTCSIFSVVQYLVLPRYIIGTKRKESCAAPKGLRPQHPPRCGTTS